MHAQRPWGNGASAYRTPCSPCPVRHLQCDTRMTNYAALKLTEMFVALGYGLDACSMRVCPRACGVAWDRCGGGACVVIQAIGSERWQGEVQCAVHNISAVRGHGRRPMIEIACCVGFGFYQSARWVASLAKCVRLYAPLRVCGSCVMRSMHC
ncbi:hypothetical protein BJD12_14730 [Xanthomonas vesicatoria ATCC 35937]|nr:hypothetical protein BJD12_14730 [Xanthomonas vesicatoria ATCC 35937]